MLDSLKWPQLHHTAVSEFAGGYAVFIFSVLYGVMEQKGSGSLNIVIADRAPEELYKTHREACADPDHISVVPLPLLQFPSVVTVLTLDQHGCPDLFPSATSHKIPLERSR